MTRNPTIDPDLPNDNSDWLKTFVRELPVKLTEHELSLYGKMLAEKNKEESGVEERKKETAARYSAELKTIRVEIKRLATARSDEEEMRPVKCAERLRGSQVEIVRLDRNEVVDVRPAEMRDMQSSIPGTDDVDDYGTLTRLPAAAPTFDTPEPDAIGPNAEPEPEGEYSESSVGDTVYTTPDDDELPKYAESGADWSAEIADRNARIDRANELEDVPPQTIGAALSQDEADEAYAARTAEQERIDADDRAYREREAASAAGAEPGTEPEAKREKRKGGDKAGKVAAHRAGKKRK